MTVERRWRKDKWGGTKKKPLALCAHRLNQALSLSTPSNHKLHQQSILNITNDGISTYIYKYLTTSKQSSHNKKLFNYLIIKSNNMMEKVNKGDLQTRVNFEFK